MANIANTQVVGQDGVMIATWLAITENDTGLPAAMARFPDKSVQVTGDFTSSGAITIEGSNDGNTWGILHDHTGTTLVLTDSVPRVIAENPFYIRPRATAGSSVSMNVYIVGAPRS